MNVHVSPEPLPQLEEYLVPSRSGFVAPKADTPLSVT